MKPTITPLAARETARLLFNTAHQHHTETINGETTRATLLLMQLEGMSAAVHTMGLRYAHGEPAGQSVWADYALDMASRVFTEIGNGYPKPDAEYMTLDEGVAQLTAVLYAAYGLDVSKHCADYPA